MRPSELFPQVLIDELLRLATLDREWLITIDNNDEIHSYRVESKFPTWLCRTNKSGADYINQEAISIWLLDGPKVFKPTPEQCKALEQIDVNVKLEEYSQPFPAILVELDYPPFNSVLCFNKPFHLVCCLISKDNKNDITTTVRRDDQMIEKSLERFDDDLTSLVSQSSKALRVAVNSCLALSHYGCHLNYLFPKEVERDKRLSQEKSDRGKRALQRLPLAVQRVSFDQEITIHRTENRQREESQPTGKQMPPHWRRGHWAMQPCGVKGSQRKRILRPPVLVRRDLFIGHTAGTMAAYST